MELFALQATSGLTIGNKVVPLKFKEVLAKGALEKDLEDLIVAQPSLTNVGARRLFSVEGLTTPTDLPPGAARREASLLLLSARRGSARWPKRTQAARQVRKQKAT